MRHQPHERFPVWQREEPAAPPAPSNTRYHPPLNMHARIALLSLLSAASLLAQSPASLTVPVGLAATEGNSNNTYPWGRGTAGGIRIQNLYDSSHFTNQAVNSPILVTRLKWRANGTTTSWGGGTYSNVTVQMSTAAVDQASPSTTFAANHGPDLLTVHSGNVAFLAGTGAGTAVPGPTVVDLPLAAPFLYNPATGSDLVVDVDFASGSFTGSGVTAIDVSTTTPLASRVYNTVNTSPTGITTINHGMVMEVEYTPANGLYAAFSTSATRGASPLTVQFTDRSFSSAPGGVVAWSWDLNGDGTVDSTAQNPSFVYGSCGTWNVSLTVLDAANPSSTLTRTGLVVTDEVTPSFTTALLAPGGVVQFTDTSTPTPTSWAWDLNGDGVTDSTAQNPIWVYGSVCGNPVTVGLVVNRLCRGPYTTSRSFVPGNSLATVTDGNTSTSTGAGGYFDLNVTNPNGISVCRMTAKTTAAANAALTFVVSAIPGTYVGQERNLAAWRTVATVASTGAATATELEVLTFNPPLYLPPGTWGLHVATATASAQYTTITASQTFTHPDVALTAGSVGILGSTPIANRLWNGSLTFSSCDNSGTAGHGYLGLGCAGTLATSRQVATALPRIGNSMSVDFDNLPLSTAILSVGLSTTNSPLGPLPLDLGGLGAPGCQLRVSPDVTAVLVGGANRATWSLAIPSSTALQCVRFHSQALVLDPTANLLGAVVSDAASSVIGL